MSEDANAKRREDLDPEKIDQRLNEYMAKVVEYRKKVPFGLKRTIELMAKKEWLDNHEKDPTIDFSRPTGNRRA